MLAVLRLEVHDQGNGVHRVNISPQHPADFPDAAGLQFVCSGQRYAQLTGAQPELQLLAPGAPWFERVLGQLHEAGNVIHSAPQQQPANVHQLTPRLLGAYRFEQGTVHLGGCTLEDRPVIRWTFLSAHPADARPRLRHVYVWPEGGVLDEPTIAALGLARVSPSAIRPPRVTEAQLRQWIEAARVHASGVASPQPGDILLASVLWCKFAEGQVVFAWGEQSVELSFAGWTRMLASGELQPPPFRCAVSGAQSHQLAVTDDDRITVVEAIAACDVSGKRVIESELETCAVSSRRALPEYLETCPLTDQRVLKSEIVVCFLCQQRVSWPSLKEGRCTACRRLQRANKQDAPLARILGEYPGLDRWRRWRLSETSRVYIVLGRQLWRQILAVVDKQSLQLRHLATAGRIVPRWKEIPAEQTDRYLR